MDFNKHFNNHVDLINSTLSSLIEANGIVSEAMRYSLLSGGKRIRGSLVLSVCEMLEGDRDAAIKASTGCFFTKLILYYLQSPSVIAYTKVSFQIGLLFSIPPPYTEKAQVFVHFSYIIAI